jgi:hypothetical protein
MASNDFYNEIDEALLPFHQHINEMLVIDGEVYDKSKEIRMSIYEVDIDSPVQLDVIVNEYGQVVVGSSPPLYYLDTGIQPVFHNIRLRAVATEPDNYNDHETRE